jgi:O-glycosyl hydrolase
MDLEEIDDSPSLLIPCENLKSLQSLVLTLVKKKIITDDTTFKLLNVPEEIEDILNDPEYFKPVNVLGFHTIKGKVRELEQKTEELL